MIQHLTEEISLLMKLNLECKKTFFVCKFPKGVCWTPFLILKLFLILKTKTIEAVNSGISFNK